VPSWYASRIGQAEALIDVRGGSLALDGVRLTRDGAPSLKHLFRVESGHCLLIRCHLTSPGFAEAGGGGWLRSRLPDQSRSTPVTRSGDRSKRSPTGRRVGSSIPCSSREEDVLSAEVSRGLVFLSGCAVAAGRTAFALNPSLVARDRFEADLCLDHTTVASESNVVALGRWPGTAPGPDRPWLVSTENCAFFGTYDRLPRDRDRESVMLRTDPASFASGVLFWQSRSDAFELPRFTVAGRCAEHPWEPAC